MDKRTELVLRLNGRDLSTVRDALVTIANDFAIDGKVPCERHGGSGAGYRHSLYVGEVEDDPEVWFMGPTDGPGYRLLVSPEAGRIQRPKHDDTRGTDQWHRPLRFPWKSMDRQWGATYKPQGTTAMDYAEGWSVLSVADYTQDSRPNVLVAFAVERPMVPEDEMRKLAQERYPTIWERLGVGGQVDG